MKLMRRLKIQRVKSVPPIPTTIIVIPKVQLSIVKIPPINRNPKSEEQRQQFNAAPSSPRLQTCSLYHSEKGISIEK